MEHAAASTSEGSGHALRTDRSKVLGVLRLAAVWAIGGGLAWFGRPSPVEWAIGLVLAASGESIRCWAAGYLVKSKELITGGPYAYVRNPLYLGRLLILCGISVAAKMPFHLNLAFLAIGLGVFFFYYVPRKERVEGARLERLHGESFRRYRAAVPSIFPTHRRYDERRGSWGWSRFGRNREAFMVLSIAVFFGVLALKA